MEKQDNVVWDMLIRDELNHGKIHRLGRYMAGEDRRILFHILGDIELDHRAGKTDSEGESIGTDLKEESLRGG